MAAPDLPPEVVGVILGKLELRDKFAFLSVCSSWRSSITTGPQVVETRSSGGEAAPLAQVVSLLNLFRRSLTRIVLHAGVVTHVSRDLLRAISLHTDLRGLVVEVEAAASAASAASELEDAPSDDDYEVLFASCNRLEEVKITGRLVLRKRPVAVIGEGLAASLRQASLSLAYVWSARRPNFSPDEGRVHIPWNQQGDFPFTIGGFPARRRSARPIAPLRRGALPVGDVEDLHARHRLARRPDHPGPSSFDPYISQWDEQAALLIATPKLPQSIGRLQYLSALHFGPDAFSMSDLSILAQLPSLTTLTIPVNGVLFYWSFVSLTGLVSLRLVLDLVRHDWDIQFHYTFSRLVNLRRLELVGPDADDEGLAFTRKTPIVKLDLKNAPATLRTLCLSGLRLSQPQRTHLSHLTRLTRLEVLGSWVCIARDTLSFRGLRDLKLDFSFLKVVPSDPVPSDLEHWDDLELGPIEQLQATAHQLRLVLQSLEVLHLVNVSFCRRWALSSLPSLPNLVELHLTCDLPLPNLGGEGGELEEKFPVLRELDLAECRCCHSCLSTRARHSSATIRGALLHSGLTRLVLRGFHYSHLPPSCHCPDACDFHSPSWQSQQEEEQQQQQQQHERPRRQGMWRWQPWWRQWRRQQQPEQHQQQEQEQQQQEQQQQQRQQDQQQQQEQQQQLLLQQQQEQQQVVEGLCAASGSSGIQHLSLHGFEAPMIAFHVALPHLQKLDLVGCPRLRSIQPAGEALAIVFPALERIDVRECPTWQHAKGKRSAVA